MPVTPVHALLAVGRISGVYGVRGFVRVFSETEPRSAIVDFPKLWLESQQGWVCREVISGRVQGRGVILQFSGVEDRDQALSMKGIRLAIERRWLPDTANGEYYWADLVGLDVCTCNGIFLGRIVDFIETGANDVMVIHGDKEYLVPWVMGRYVRSVDLDESRIEVDWDPDF